MVTPRAGGSWRQFDSDRRRWIQVAVAGEHGWHGDSLLGFKAGGGCGPSHELPIIQAWPRIRSNHAGREEAAKRMGRGGACAHARGAAASTAGRSECRQMHGAGMGPFVAASPGCSIVTITPPHRCCCFVPFFALVCVCVCGVMWCRQYVLRTIITVRYCVEFLLSSKRHAGVLLGVFGTETRLGYGAFYLGSHPPPVEWAAAASHLEPLPRGVAATLRHALCKP